MKNPTTEEIKEWAQSPITEQLLKLVEHYIETFEAMGLEAYHPAEPQKTQEMLCTLNTQLYTWRNVTDLLRGEWDLVIEDEDEDE